MIARVVRSVGGLQKSLVPVLLLVGVLAGCAGLDAQNSPDTLDRDGALLLQATEQPPAAVPTGTPNPAKPPKYVVLMVLDGARPGYLATTGIPHVRALMKGGTVYKNAFAGILESETPSGHAAIASGSEPRVDGILGFTWADADRKRVTIYDPALIQSGVMERLMSHGPTIAGLVHQHNPAAKVVALGSYKYYANDALGGPDADVILYYEVKKNGTFGLTAVPRHVPPRSLLTRPDLTAKSSKLPLGEMDHLAMKSAIESFQLLHQRVTLINLPEFDMPLGHINGANRDPKDVARLMHTFDSDLAAMENAYRAAGVLDQTLFVITADHGFAPINHHVPFDVIRSAVLKTGTAVIHGNYHTGAYLWVTDQAKARQAALNIAALKGAGIQSVYYRLPDGTYSRVSSDRLLHVAGIESANQYLLQTFSGPDGPDLVVFFREGTMGAQHGEANWKGDHGGADWESQHIPLLLSGPGIRARHTSTYPARLIDIAPTVLEALGVPHAPMRGLVLADALRAPSVAAQASQEAQRDKLTAVVTALRGQATSERTSP